MSFSLNLDDKITEHFVWREVLFLPKFKLYCYPDLEQYNNLKLTVAKLELIRSLVKCPIKITSGLRPGIYNSYIGGAKQSTHKVGLAADFIVNGFDTYSACNHVRNVLIPYLDEFQIRLEDMSTANWIHIDLRGPGPAGRFFKP